MTPVALVRLMGKIRLVVGTDVPVPIVTVVCADARKKTAELASVNATSNVVTGQVEKRGHEDWVEQPVMPVFDWVNIGLGLKRWVTP